MFLKIINIYILCGIHKGGRGDINESKQNLLNSINKIIENNHDKFKVLINEPDIHLSIFRKCKNLLLHRGGFSGLGYILFNPLTILPTDLSVNVICNLYGYVYM